MPNGLSGIHGAFLHPPVGLLPGHVALSHEHFLGAFNQLSCRQFFLDDLGLYHEFWVFRIATAAWLATALIRLTSVSGKSCGFRGKTIENADDFFILDFKGDTDHGYKPQFSGHLFFFESGFLQNILENQRLVMGGHEAHYPFIHTEGAVLLQYSVFNGLGCFQPNFFGSVSAVINEPEGTDFNAGDLSRDHDDQFQDIFQVKIRRDGPADICEGFDVLVIGFRRDFFHRFLPRKSLRFIRLKIGYQAFQITGLMSTTGVLSTTSRACTLIFDG